MKLSAMIENLGIVPVAQSVPVNDLDIKGLALDSRVVEPGFLFAALQGEKVDGRDYIASALKAGAKSILLQTGSEIDNRFYKDVCVLEHDNPRLALAEMAGRFFFPQPSYCAAITGTNGKTSVASFVKQFWTGLGFEAASIGTLGVESDKFVKTTGLTTPDTISFHESLQALAKAGVDHVVFEASSHGLDQHRLDGVEVKVAGFTNLSHEHLDYHHTMEDYFQAKSRLFVELLSPKGVAVINTDSEWGKKLAQLCAANAKSIMTVGQNDEATIKLVSCDEVLGGYKCVASYQGKEHGFTLSLLGRFQVDNALLAAGMVLAEGVLPEKVFSAINSLRGVDGRMELAGVCANGARVLIDYAHTPDGLKNALTSLQSFRENGRLMIVFGCGGNRDKAKRPVMGAIAESLADFVFVTDDNPRDDNPAAIRQEILSGSPSAFEFADRGDAIKSAVSKLSQNDILLITGKGHEQGQIVGEKVLPFSDFEAVKAAIKTFEKVEDVK